MPVSGKARPHPQESPESIELLGGRLCLDFANSVDWTEAGEPLDEASDALLEPDGLARWGRRLLGAGVLPAVGPGELAAARELRASTYRAFAALAEGRRPPPADLELIAGSHAEAAAAARLAPEGGSWRMTWPAAHPRRIRFAVAADAVQLLADAELLARLRRCPGRRCGWLFLDRSGRRKWCSMASCGSREKMRRLYERQRAVRSKVA
jgi:predicted RNA-binding Zn ribbon-like protein